MSSRCSRLGISALNFPVLLCRFAGFALFGVVVACRVRLWALSLACARCFCWLAVFGSQDEPPPLPSRFRRSELCLLLSSEGAHRATPNFILVPSPPPQRLFFVSGSRPRLPFRFPVLRSFFVSFFSFSSCQAFLQKKSSLWGFFLQKGLTHPYNSIIMLIALETLRALTTKRDAGDSTNERKRENKCLS